MLEFDGGSRKPTIPFNFNLAWLKEEGFQLLVKNSWVPFDLSLGLSTTIQFANNLKRVKKVTTEWAYNKRLRDE
jgi:hypothetical protein